MSKRICKKLPDEFRSIVDPLFNPADTASFQRQFLARINQDLRTSFNDIDFGSIVAPTTFIHAGYTARFLLLLFGCEVHFYSKTSPNPFKKNVIPKPDFIVEKNVLVDVNDRDLVSFTLEPKEWNKCTYILIREVEN
jgi:hypothetical protein